MDIGVWLSWFDAPYPHLQKLDGESHNSSQDVSEDPDDKGHGGSGYITDDEVRI